MKIKTDNKIRILLFMLITTMLVFIKPIIGYSNTQLYVKQGGAIRVSNTLTGEINSNNKEKKARYNQAVYYYDTSGSRTNLKMAVNTSGTSKSEVKTIKSNVKIQNATATFIFDYEYVVYGNARTTAIVDLKNVTGPLTLRFYQYKWNYSDYYYDVNICSCPSSAKTTGGAKRSNATCTAPATYYYKCGQCGAQRSDYYNSGSALGHSYTSKTQTSTYLRSNATCTAAATYWYKCSRCTAKGSGSNYYSVGSALGHVTPSSWSHDGSNHYKNCTRCGTRLQTVAHTKPSSWSHDASNHYKNCTVCGRRLETVAHTKPSSWSSDASNHYKNCTVCGRRLETVAHTKPSSWSHDASNHYKNCTVCGRRLETVAHTWPSSWTQTNTIHYKNCTTCGRRLSEGSHADSNSDGLCDTCGRDTQPPKCSRTTYVVDGTGYYYYAYITDNSSGVKEVKFPSWTVNGGQDDLQPNWSTSTSANGTSGNWTVNGQNYNWRYRVEKSAHKNENGPYNTDVYAYDNNGNGGYVAGTGNIYLTVTLTFDANGGKFSDGSSTKQYTWVIGSSQTPESPAKTDFEFTGWNGWNGTVPVSQTTYKATWKGKPPIIHSQPSEIELIEYFDMDKTTYLDKHSKDLTGILDYSYATKDITIDTGGGSDNSGKTNTWTWYVSSDKKNWSSIGDDTMTRTEPNGMKYTASAIQEATKKITLNLNYTKRNVNSFYYKAKVKNTAGSVETSPIKLTVYWLPTQYSAFAQLKPGKEVNEILKTLVNGSNKAYTEEDTIISQIIPSYIAPSVDKKKVNLAENGSEIFAWAENDPDRAGKKIIKYYIDPSKATGILFPVDASYMFNKMTSLEILKLPSAESSKTTDMSYMLAGCQSLTTLDIKKLDSSPVRNLTHFMDGCSSIENVNLSRFDTRNAENMASMFEGCTNMKTLTLRRMVMDACQNTSRMFYGCSNLSYSLVMNSTSVTNYADMFKGCSISGFTIVNYETGCKAVAESMVNTKNANDKVFLYENYLISYNLNNGSWDMEKGKDRYSILDEEYKLPTPVRKGYEFIGWTGSNGNTPQKEIAIPKYSTGDRAYSANWSPNTYTIGYALNGGTVENAPTSYTPETDDLIIPNATKHGYEFLGWTEVGKDIPKVDYTIPRGSSGNIVLQAKWKAVNYVINYELNGGILNNRPMYYTIDTPTILLGTPVREYYKFLGWTGSNGDVPQETTTIPTGSTGDKTYIANWEAENFTITYNLDGGTANDLIEIYSPDTPGFYLTKPTKDGYRFTGWTGTNGTTPEEEVFIPSGSAGNREYTANWELETYTIRYKLNDGILANPIVSYTVETETFELPTPTKQGGTFLGWSEENDQTIELIKTIQKGTTGNKVFIANWKNEEYTIRYNLEGGEITGEVTSYNVSTPGFNLPIPTRDGYSFIGWTGSNGNVPQETIYIPTGSVGDRNYTANWATMTYKIEYDINDGVTPVVQKTYNIDSPEFTLPTPAREHYTFLGWTGSNGDVPELNVVIPYGSTGNRNYIGNWEPIKYSINCMVGEGAVIEGAPDSYTIESPDITLPEPTKANDTFIGWIGSNGDFVEKTIVIQTGSYGDVLYEAVWASSKYGIDYDLDGGTIKGEKTTYTQADAGYVPPTPTKPGFIFAGWDPERIEPGRAGDIIFSVIWREN